MTNETKTAEQSMYYREIAPCDELAEIVFSFWEFRINLPTPQPILHEVFPDGCRSLLYHRNSKLKVENLLVSSLSLETVRIPVFEDDVYWGMRISPVASRVVFNDEPGAKNARSASEIPILSKIAAALIEKLSECESFEAAICEFETILRRLPLPKIDGRIAAAVKFIEDSGAQVAIEETAAEVGLSRRQFERLFVQFSGLTPKQYLRARRIRATAVKLVENAAENWARRAAEMGFADQAHLSHEFSNLTSCSPGAFAERVRQIEHGKLIK